MIKIFRYVFFILIIFLLASCESQIGLPGQSTTTTINTTVIETSTTLPLTTTHVVGSKPELNINEEFVVEYAIGSRKPNWLEAVNVYDPNNQNAMLTYQNVDDSNVDFNHCGTYDVFFIYQDVIVKLPIHIVDDTEPNITLIGENEIFLRYGEPYIEQGATALDENNDDLTQQISITGSVNIFQVGQYELTYLVSDENGNQASVIRTIHVLNDLSYVIKDDALKKEILNCLGKPYGPITFEDALRFKYLDLKYLNIKSIEGIEYFSNLIYLNLKGNHLNDISPLLDLYHRPLDHNPYIRDSNIYLEDNPLDTSFDSNNYQVIEQLINHHVHVDISRDVLLETNHSFINPKKIKLGKTLDTMDFFGDIDTFKLELSETKKLSIYTKSNIDTQIMIYDENFELITKKDYGGEDFNFKLNITLNVGTYYLSINTLYADITSRIGDYELYIDSYHSVSRIPVTLTDPVLEQVIKNELNNDFINMDDCLTIESLNLQDYSISHLSGLEYLSNLTTLIIDGEYINDYHSISQLSNLKYLKITNSQIDDLSFLNELDQLEYLILPNNQIKNIEAISNLENLKKLNLESNHISELTTLSILYENGCFSNDLKYLDYHININDNPVDFDINGNNYLTFDYLTQNQILIKSDYEYKSDDYPNTFKESTVITLDSIIEGKIEYLLDKDVFQFHLTQPTHIHLSIINNPYISILLYNEQKIMLVPHIVNNNHINITLPQGTYYIELHSIVGELNEHDYQLSLYEHNIEENKEIVYISDPYLDSAIRKHLNKPIGVLTKEELSSITHLNASFSQISDITDIIYLNNLSYLQLSYNDITDITPLSHLTKLTFLHINGNNISNIQALENLENLVYLNIKGNPIDELPYNQQIINYFIFYGRTVYYDGDTSISDDYTNHYESAQSIQLNQVIKGNLYEQDEDWFKLSIDEDIILTILFNNYINFYIYENQELQQHITGYNNRFLLRPGTYHIHLTSSTKCDYEMLLAAKVVNQTLTINNMDPHLESVIKFVLNLPEDIILTEDHLALIKTLNASNQNISSLEGIQYMINATNLNFSQNNVYEIPSLENLEKLHTLNLSSNYISDITGLSHLKNIATLNLKENDLEDISILNTNQNLKILDLSYNNITDINVLSNLVFLKTLYLDHNNISDISFISDLKSLSVLDVSYNSIETIPKFNNSLLISELYLHENYIDVITNLTSYIHLSEVTLENNNLIHNIDNYNTYQTLINRGVDIDITILIR